MLIDEVFMLDREDNLMIWEVILLIDGLIYLIVEVFLPMAEVKMPDDEVLEYRGVLREYPPLVTYPPF